MFDLMKSNDNLEKCFSLLIGQYSPSTEQSLSGGKEYDVIKEKYDAIGLIKFIERICYNY